MLHSNILGPNLERAVADIGLDGRLEKDADRDLRIGGLGPELEVRIAETLAHRIDANEGA